MKLSRMFCLLALISSGFPFHGPSAAADVVQGSSGFAPLAPGEREHMASDATEKRGQARSLRSEAESEFRRTEATCYKKILVSNCLDGAKKERMRKSVEARQLDLDANRIDREIRLRESAQRKSEAAQSTPEREAAAAEAAARNREEAEAQTADRAERDAQRERELQEAPARAEAEAARRQANADGAAKRQATEARRARERADAAARQREKIDRKTAEHARRREEAAAAAAKKAGSGKPAAE